MARNVTAMARNSWLGAVAMTGLTYGSYLTFSNYIFPYSERTGHSIGAIALLFSASGLGTVIFSLLLGGILRRFQVRAVVPVAAIGFAFPYLALAFSDSLIVLYMAGFVFGAAVVFTGFGLSQTEIMWWFSYKQIGRRLTALTSGLAIMTFIESPLVALSIQRFGLSATAVGQGILTTLMIILISWTLLHERPSHYGVVVDTAPPKARQAPLVVGSGFMPRAWPFWLILGASVIEGLVFTGYSNNASPFYQSFGLDPVQASLGISIVSGLQAVTALIFGYLVDKIGLRVSVLGFGTVVILTLLSAQFVQGFGAAMTWAVFMSFFAFVNFVGPVGLRTLFPHAEAGAVNGYGGAASQLGVMLGAPAAGFIFTATGSYIGFTNVAAGLMLICVVIVWIALTTRGKRSAALSESLHAARYPDPAPPKVPTESTAPGV
ncbi:MFS transporter [Pseudarthrobacter sp. fls2-241-R2A-168]|uniref:MFS transporter n=1 Tax=Pseudarthrobacter sp. fls2-241-R2A-168 TaxID=3040304 RepID=UPI002554D862|nr:MFS transporter [Pseudarthrobacter sp. fls2-241-R2A-168]